MCIRRSFVLFAVTLLVCFSLAGSNLVSAATTQKALAKKAVLREGAAYLQSQQDESGGYKNGRGDLDRSLTAQVVMTLLALQNVGITVDFDAAVVYLQTTPPITDEPDSGADSLVILALVAAGGDPRDVDGVDLVARVLSTWDEATGQYGVYLLLHALAIPALFVAGEEIPEAAIDRLISTQMDDGSWTFDGTIAPGAGELTVTSLAIQSLVAVGHGDDPAIAKAIGYLHTLNRSDGTFGYLAEAPADANTCGFAILGLNAAGENAKSSEWSNAAAALIKFQNESGGFRYNDLQPDDDFLSTMPALLALAGAAFPVLPAS